MSRAPPKRNSRQEDRSSACVSSCLQDDKDSIWVPSWNVKCKMHLCTILPCCSTPRKEEGRSIMSTVARLPLRGMSLSIPEAEKYQ